MAFKQILIHCPFLNFFTLENNSAESDIKVLSEATRLWEASVLKRLRFKVCSKNVMFVRKFRILKKFHSYFIGDTTKVLSEAQF